MSAYDSRRGGADRGRHAMPWHDLRRSGGDPGGTRGGNMPVSRGDALWSLGDSRGATTAWRGATGDEHRVARSGQGRTRIREMAYWSGPG